MKLGLGLSLSGQRGASAGGPPARTAADVLAETVAWWEADHVSNVAVSGAFSQLTDLSGNGNHLVQATSTLRPARVEAGGEVYADFNGVDDVMTCATPTAALMNNFNAGGTGIQVVHPENAGGGGFGRVWEKNNTAAENCFYTSPSVGFMEMWMNFNYTTTGIFFDATTRLVAQNADGIQDFHVDKSLLDEDDLIVRHNGAAMPAAKTAPAGTPTDMSAGTFLMGNSPAGTRGLSGRIYALAFWDTELSDADRALVVEAWATKYGVTLA